MEKVIVTGATGFIGKHLVEALHTNGFEVIRSRGDTAPRADISRIYHLASPSSNDYIYNNTLYVMDTIMDVTRSAMKICPTALFINASSMGAAELAETPQGAYNIAKRCMEVYIQHSGIQYLNYRIPSVYGAGMHDDAFIKRCIDGNAYNPTRPTTLHSIAHIEEVVDALVSLRPINIEIITLGQIYELFNSGRRGLHRPEPNTSTI